MSGNLFDGSVDGRLMLPGDGFIPPEGSLLLGNVEGRLVAGGELTEGLLIDGGVLGRLTDGELGLLIEGEGLGLLIEGEGVGLLIEGLGLGLLIFGAGRLMPPPLPPLKPPPPLPPPPPPPPRPPKDQDKSGVLQITKVIATQFKMIVLIGDPFCEVTSG
jgi:hypothetical protein